MILFHEQTGKLRTWARRTLWFLLIVGILCAIVIPIFMIYRKEGTDARSAVDVEPQGVSHTGDYIHVVATVSSVDFEDKNYRVHFEFTPHGTLAGDDGILTEDIEIALFYTTLNFPEGQIMQVLSFVLNVLPLSQGDAGPRSVDVTMPYTRGAPIDYPFDRYVSYFEILIHKEKEKLHKIPVSFTFLAMLQTVEFIPVLHLDPTDTYKIAMQITTNRSPTTIGFSIFVVVIMWALSISISIITIQVVRKHRESDEHILTLGITTLFVGPMFRLD
ncbi:hypothetical protein DFQ26_008149 [Actinomortierella ambigua]|nr:hypothetical protein DFQ26_008149 [Actinomortierella ambigua]